MRKLRVALVSTWLATLPLIARAAVDPQVSAPVPVVQDGRLDVVTAKGKGVVPIHASRDWTQVPPDVTRAVIVIHGRPRRDLQSGEVAAARAGSAATDAILITPQFLIPADIDAHHLPRDTLRWGRSDWKVGGDAVGPAPISFFDVLDAILARLADRRFFARLRTVVIAGHSAGGQFVQRYAAVGHGQGPLERLGVHLRYVVANPSSYVHLTPDRPVTGNGRTDETSATCPQVNDWEYGFGGRLPSYVIQPIEPHALERAYLARDVVYLPGTSDNDPEHPQLDRSCAAAAQGVTRLDRVFATLPTCRRVRMVNGRNGCWRCPASDAAVPRCSRRIVAVPPCSTRRDVRRERRLGPQLPIQPPVHRS